MKVKDLMTKQVIRILPEETAAVAARVLEHYNIGALPVCAADGSLRGMLTDRDLAIRCMASERGGRTPVGEIMTGRVVSVRPNADPASAAALMARNQVRRLPVVEGGKLCGILSLADLARREETEPAAEEALEGISAGVSRR